MRRLSSYTRMNQDKDVKLDTMNTVDSWHFNKAQMNRKTTKIHVQWNIFSNLKRKWNPIQKKKNTMMTIISVYLMDFIQRHNKALLRLYIPCLIVYTLTHFLQRLCCFIGTRLQQLNVITKNTSICQNISVQCQHILKEHMIKNVTLTSK